MQKAKPFDESEIVLDLSQGWAIGYCNILNNFHLHFPLGDIPVKTGGNEGMYRSQARELGAWDRPFGETMEEDGGRFFTELRLRQTGAEFYAVLDGVVATLGLQMPRISEAINDARVNKVGDQEEKHRVLYELLLPVYKEMRKKGYDVMDLRG